MRKLFVLLLLCVLIPLNALAGGIMTNTNQSASFIRMPVRNASLQVDAAYYNPAGLARLDDGIHLSLNNQSIFQTRKIDSSFPLLNDGKYTGSVTAPVFPAIYAVYKSGRIAFSGGFMPVGGGGGAEYGRGLPSFESDFAAVPLMMSMNGINTSAYDVDIFFEGSSVFFGAQAGVSYRISDMADLYAGARYVTAANTYKGHLQNLTVNPVHPLNPGGGMISAHGFFTTLSGMAAGAATSVEPIISGGGGNLTLQQAVLGGLITQDQANQLAGGLGNNYQAGMTISQVQGAYQMISTEAGATAGELVDRRVDARQKGSAILPVVGVNLSPSDRFNIGIKYEFLTRLELENETEVDETGMFPDGATTRNDMPAMLSAGAAFRATQKLNVTAGVHYYFDRAANYGKTFGGLPVSNREVIDRNFIEAGLGIEYNLSGNLLVSGGYLATRTGVNEKFQNDMDHSLSTNSFGLGARYAVSPMLGVNLGFLMTFYDEASRSITTPLGNITEKYNREVMVFAIGADFKF